MIALYESSMNGVPKSYLRFHASITALNSISAIVISLPVNSKRARFALLFDSFCDALYAVGPIGQLLYSTFTMFSEASKEKYCLVRR
jgi:hypothetical protein